MFNDLQFRLRALFRRKAMENELEEEIRFHFDCQVAKHMAAGMTQEEARRRGTNN